MMRYRPQLVLVTAALLGNPLQAQESSSYEVPRTEFGRPDLNGVWGINFVTVMERFAPDLPLVVDAAQAETLAREWQAEFRDGNTDPEMLWVNDMGLARVNGEYRTSLITQPADGMIPFSELGKQLSTEQSRLDREGFDGPEQRELSERCLGGLAGPPMAAIPIPLPRLVVQTETHVVIYTEDVQGLRIIPLDTGAPTGVPRWITGDSRGHWEGDTLVIITDNFRHDLPTRAMITSHMAVGPDTRVVERLTRISREEILYQFTVEDDTMYTEPWSGEYPWNWIGGGSYTYDCHEGNYSLPGILLGGRVQQADAEAAR